MECIIHIIESAFVQTGWTFVFSVTSIVQELGVIKQLDIVKVYCLAAMLVYGGAD